MNIKNDRFTKEIKMLSPWLSEDSNKGFLFFHELFNEYLYNMTEFSMTPMSKNTGIMLTGKGNKFISAMIEYLRSLDISEGQLEIFNNMNHFFPDVNISLKIDFSPDGMIKPSFYHHKLIPGITVSKIMKELNINKESISDFLDIICFLLRKKELFVGFSFPDNKTNLLKTFFHNSIADSGSSLYPGIAAIMAKMNFHPNIISLFMDYNSFLSQNENRGIFTSVVFNDTIMPVLKIDYEDVTFDKVSETYKSINTPPEGINLLKQWCDELETDRITYFGIKFQNEKLPEFKCYFTRRYAVDEDPANFVDLINNTTWE